MRIETRQGILDRDWIHLTQWSENVFPTEGLGKEWSAVSWHSIAYSDDGDAVGHIGFDGFTVAINAVRQRVVGIGGVVVRPECQGQGIPAKLFREVHHQAEHHIGTKLFILFCPARLVPYYVKHGYQQHRGSVRFLQYGESVPSQFELMHLGDIDPSAPLELETPPW